MHLHSLRFAFQNSTRPDMILFRIIMLFFSLAKEPYRQHVNTWITEAGMISNTMRKSHFVMDDFFLGDVWQAVVPLEHLNLLLNLMIINIFEPL